MTTKVSKERAQKEVPPRPVSSGRRTADRARTRRRIAENIVVGISTLVLLAALILTVYKLLFIFEG